MITDYIVDILGDKYVVLIENNRLEKVDIYNSETQSFYMVDHFTNNK